MPDDLEMRRRRAAYRASHRGTKEMDIILGRYAEAGCPVCRITSSTLSSGFWHCLIPMLTQWFSRGATSWTLVSLPR